jgi:hypothetical protein
VALLKKIQYSEDAAFGYFEVIKNLFEADEKKDKPVAQEKILHDYNIEGTYLTHMRYE